MFLTLIELKISLYLIKVVGFAFGESNLVLLELFYIQRYREKFICFSLNVSTLTNEVSFVSLQMFQYLHVFVIVTSILSSRKAPLFPRPALPWISRNSERRALTRSIHVPVVSYRFYAVHRHWNSRNCRKIYSGYSTVSETRIIFFFFFTLPLLQRDRLLSSAPSPLSLSLSSGRDIVLKTFGKL